MLVIVRKTKMFCASVNRWETVITEKSCFLRISYKRTRNTSKQEKQSVRNTSKRAEISNDGLFTAESRGGMRSALGDIVYPANKNLHNPL